MKAYNEYTRKSRNLYIDFFLQRNDYYSRKHKNISQKLLVHDFPKKFMKRYFIRKKGFLFVFFVEATKRENIAIKSDNI